MRVFDFLAVFLGKLLKKNYLKDLAYKQIQIARQKAAKALYGSGDTLNLLSLDLSSVLGVLGPEPNASAGPGARFETLRQVDLTKKLRIRAKRYEGAVSQMMLYQGDFLEKKNSVSQNVSLFGQSGSTKDVSFAFEYFDEGSGSVRRKTLRDGSSGFGGESRSVLDGTEYEPINSTYMGRAMA